MSGGGFPFHAAASIMNAKDILTVTRTQHPRSPPHTHTHTHKHTHTHIQTLNTHMHTHTFTPAHIYTERIKWDKQGLILQPCVLILLV